MKSAGKNWAIEAKGPHMNSFAILRNPLARLFLLFLLNVACLALADANVSAQETYKTSEGIPLTFTLRPQRNVIFLNEPVDMTLELSTAGNEQFDFLSCLPGSPTGDQKFSITTENGKAPTIIPRSGPCISWAQGPIKESCHPHSSYGYDLSQMATFEEPGNYEITIEREVEVQNRRTGVRDKIRIKVSTPIQVVPRTPENVGEFVARNGQELLKENGDDFYIALWRLFRVRDPQAAQYYQQVLMAHFNDPEQDEWKSDLEPDEEVKKRLDRARETANLLGSYATDEAVETLLKLLKSPSCSIRRAGFIGLLGCSNHRALSPDVQKAMISLWDDPYVELRLGVIHFLRDNDHPERERILSRMTNDSNEFVRKDATRSLEELKSPPVP